MRAGPPYEASRIRRASPMGSATLTAAASAAMIGAAVRHPMVAPEAAVDRAFPDEDAFGMTERSVSSRGTEVGYDRGAVRASRAASAVERIRRPASIHDEGGESHMGPDAEACAAARMSFQCSAACAAKPSESASKKASGGGLPAAREMADVRSLSGLPKELAMAWMISAAERCSEPAMTRPSNGRGMRGDVPSGAPMGMGGEANPRWGPKPGRGGGKCGGGGTNPVVRSVALMVAMAESICTVVRPIAPLSRRRASVWKGSGAEWMDARAAATAAARGSATGTGAAAA